MRTILLPTDFSVNAQKAVDYALSVFGTEDVNYILLNVYSEPHTSADMLVSIVDLLEISVNEQRNICLGDACYL